MIVRMMLVTSFVGVCFVFPLSAKEPLGLVVYKNGGALLVSGSRTRNLQTNDLVGQGDVLRTTTGRITVQLRSGVVFAISPNTNVTVDKLQAKAVSLKVGQGSVSAQVKKGDGFEFQVVAPTAIAGVRGTDVIVEVEPAKGESKVMVENGTVEVTDPSGEKKEVVGDGEKVTSTTKGIQKGILEAFEKQKFEIFKEFDRVKKANLEMIIEQKRINRDLMKKQMEMK